MGKNSDDEDEKFDIGIIIAKARESSNRYRSVMGNKNKKNMKKKGNDSWMDVIFNESIYYDLSNEEESNIFRGW